MSVMEPDLQDPALVAEVDLARAAAQEEAGDEGVGAHVGPHVDGEAAVTHLFEADKPGYRGWRWAVTLTSAGPGTEVTVSEVVLIPGPDALVAPDWVPWERRVKAGDLGVGDLLPTAPDDPRLVPAYVASDDPAVEEVATDVGLGRVRVMARPARLDAATRWQHSEFGPRSDMARSAPAHCGTCGFYLPLAGSLRAAFGTCGNEISPADGHVVHAEYGCGAHSEAEVEQVSPVLVANLIYDDARLDVEPLVTQEPAVEEPTVEEAERPASATGFVAAADGEVSVVDAGRAPAPVERDDVAGPAQEPVATGEPAGGDVTPGAEEAPAPPVSTAETPSAAGAPEPPRQSEATRTWAAPASVPEPDAARTGPTEPAPTDTTRDSAAKPPPTHTDPTTPTGPDHTASAPDRTPGPWPTRPDPDESVRTETAQDGAAGAGPADG